MAELDVNAVITTTGAWLHLLQRDLNLESVRVKLEENQIARASLLKLLVFSGCSTW